MAGVRRFSKQRQLVYDTVRNTDCHPTADYIYSTLKPRLPDLSLGTVYRNLSVLVEMGLIQKVASSGGTERYDAKCEEHYHMICSRCGGLFDVPLDYNKDLDQDTNKISRHTITKHDIIFSGICENCAKAATKKQTEE